MGWRDAPEVGQQQAAPRRPGDTSVPGDRAGEWFTEPKPDLPPEAPVQRWSDAPERVPKPGMAKQPGTPLWSSMLQGVASTLSLGLDDELGAALDWMDNGTPYSQALERQRSLKGQAYTQNPAGYIGGGLTGAVATAPLMPMVAVPGAGAGWAARGLSGALTGATYGGVYGFNEGEGFENRVENAGRGALLGAGLGAAVPYAGNVVGMIPGVPAAGRAIRSTGGRIGEMVGGMFNRTKNIPKKAALRVNEALRLDAGIKDRTANMLAQRAPVVQQARDAGTPMVLADTGDEWTRALLRSATNTSPEGRGVVGAVLRDRFDDQTSRATDFAKGLFGTAGDNGARIEGLRRSAEAFNRPAYDAAYASPAASRMWNARLQQLTASPDVQRAITGSTRTAANDAALRGVPAQINPFTRDASGRLVLRTNRDGTTAVPTLQFWDHVQRNLRNAIKVGERQGADVSQLKQLRTALTNELDNLVPEFRRARAGAAAFFGAEDALEAGQLAIRNPRAMTNRDMQRAYQRLSPPEQALFREGAAGELITDIGRIGDNRNITNSRWWNTVDGRERVGVIFGREKAAEWEGFGRLENVMNSTRRAAEGNSSTARQLIEVGLAGAGAGAWMGGGFNPADPSTWTTALLTGALAIGARRGMARIDEKTSREVARLLASGSGDDIQKAANLISRNPGLMVALRNADDLLIKAVRPAGGLANTPFTANVSAAYAEQERDAQVGGGR